MSTLRLSDLKTSLPLKDIKVLNEYHIDLLTPLDANARKHTQVFKSKAKNESDYLLKVVGEECSQKSIDSFLTEISFYTRFSGGRAIPRLVASGDRFLLLEFIEGVPLDRYYKDSKIDDVFVFYLIDQLILFYQGLSLKGQNGMSSSNFSNAYAALSALFNSGPKDLKKIRRGAGMILFNRIISLVARWKLSCLVKKIEDDLVFCGFQHGDMHSRNILFDGNDIHVIDFENARYDGYFEFDVIYCLVGFCQLNRDALVSDFHLDSCFKDVFGPANYLNRIISLFQAAAENNPWFGGNDSLLRKLRLAIKVVFL